MHLHKLIDMFLALMPVPQLPIPRTRQVLLLRHAPLPLIIPDQYIVVLKDGSDAAMVAHRNNVTTKFVYTATLSETSPAGDLWALCFKAGSTPFRVTELAKSL
ncbi:hypothetical protein ACQCSU_08150 [Pseudarthrobacter sp. O4]|uniref:hypothetical protein n=1 Tax=Pseudarthrobacter sp. O4 TaxID=3418417 RepID=UPI003CF38CE0